MSHKPRVFELLKSQRQKAYETFKLNTEKQKKAPMRYTVHSRPDGAVIRTCTLEEFTAWAGTACRAYYLKPVQ